MDKTTIVLFGSRIFVSCPIRHCVLNKMNMRVRRVQMNRIDNLILTPKIGCNLIGNTFQIIQRNIFLRRK